jgi:hypothetical protein
MYSRSENAAAIVRGSASGFLLEAALLLAIGFYLRWSGLEGVSRSQLYNWSVDVVVWTFLVGGFLILGVMLLCRTGRPWTLLVDGLVNLLIGASLVGCGVIWLSHSDIQGILILISGLLVLSAAKGSWTNYRLALQAMITVPSAQPPLVRPEESAASAAPDPQAKAEAMERLLSTKQARPAVPAKVDIRRKDEPVPDGFLAELGREQEPKRE